MYYRPTLEYASRFSLVLPLAAYPCGWQTPAWNRNTTRTLTTPRPLCEILLLDRPKRFGIGRKDLPTSFVISRYPGSENLQRIKSFLGNMKDFGEPSPNRGQSVNADEVVPNQQSLQEWRKDAGIDVTKHVRLVKLSHMRYQHKDLETITAFLKGLFASLGYMLASSLYQDFGMQIVKKSANKTWFAGYGNDQYVYVAEQGAEDRFLGGVYLVESEEDLEK